ncbi:MAG: hypothetical protein ACREOY_00025 [Candidatus Dormibacteraceae bacterium]
MADRKKGKKRRIAADLRLIKVDAAARRLGCHVETLRLRIRSGKLRALRGPHGAYFIRFVDFLQLRARKPPAPPAPHEADLELAWRKAQLRAREQLGEEHDEPSSVPGGHRRNAARATKKYTAIRRQPQPAKELQTLVIFLDAVKKNPKLHAGAYRLLLSQGLSAMEFRPKQIAAVLGISERHVRRLARMRVIAESVYRAARRWGEREARRLVAELRHQLATEGLRYHRSSGSSRTPAHPDRPRPAFIITRLTYDEVMGLRRAALSDKQIWAITVAGIGSDELNQLLLRGAR